MRLRVMFLTLLCAFLLAGCYSTPKKSDEENRAAAKTNTALGRQYTDRGQYEIALDKLKRAVAQDPTYAPAHTMLAVLYETIGEYEQAGKEYREALRFAPKDGSVNNNYGAFVCTHGRAEEAEKYFLAAVKDPFYDTPEVAYANAGSCALQQGNLDKAEPFLRQSLQYDDKLAAALLPMAELNFQQGDFLRARAFLQRYADVGSMNAESLLLGFRIESKLGDEQAARRYRAMLMERFPDSPEAGWTAGREEG
ncbi:MAG: type IV pilus biogenesis/stability protein PilW [Xanthomonadales bacterium]|nr:type IV pilus biogenesis/stability protein PilW [Xanthomonadales bacterium]